MRVKDNIRLSPMSHNITMIVTEFGKLRYNCIHMGMCASCDIFQAIVNELFHDIEVIKKYIDYIFVLGTESFSKHT